MNIESLNKKAIEFSIVILCFQAGEFVKKFVLDVMHVLSRAGISDYELILVGNYLEGKDDVTPQVVKEIASQNSKIKYMAQKKKGMMGWDVRCGLQLACGRYIVILEGDGQVSPQSLIDIYREITKKKLDLVKTYRIFRQDSFLRRSLSLIYNMLFHIIFPQVKSRDINSKPKIISHDALRKLKLTSDDWFIDAEIMIQAQKQNLKIGEVPIVFSALQGRNSFVNIKTIFEFLKNLVKYKIRNF